MKNELIAARPSGGWDDFDGAKAALLDSADDFGNTGVFIRIAAEPINHVAAKGHAARRFQGTLPGRQPRADKFDARKKPDEQGAQARRGDIRVVAK